MSAGEPVTRAEHFYVDALEHLLRSGVPFMIGGAYAMREYAGIFRETKDIDVFCKYEHYPIILQVLAKAGYQTEVTDPRWLGKAFSADYFVDVIFNSGNGLVPVDDTWLEFAPEVGLMGCTVRLVPPEEMIVSKAHVHERDRYDGADIVHIIRKTGSKLDWRRLLARMDANWEVLLAHLIHFRFVYPSERDTVPRWLMEELLSRVQQQLRTPPPSERVTRGPLLAPKQYEIDIAEWGYRDVRPIMVRGWNDAERESEGFQGAHRRAGRPARARAGGRSASRPVHRDL